MLEMGAPDSTSCTVSAKGFWKNYRRGPTSLGVCRKSLPGGTGKPQVLGRRFWPMHCAETAQFPNTGISRIGGVNARLPSTTRLKTHSRSRFCLNELRLVGREKQIARQCLVDLCLSPPCLH
jgi:hypothetical protein